MAVDAPVAAAEAPEGDDYCANHNYAFLLTIGAFAAPVIVALGFLIAGAASAQVPVIDNENLGERVTRDEKTTEIKEVDSNRFSMNKSVTCAMYRPGRRDDPASAAEANPEIAGLVKRVAREEGVDETLFMSLVYQESRFNPCAKSEAGAIGLSQLMPGTAAGLGVNPHNIEANLRGGARYLKQQLETFHGNTNLALAAYNAGPGNVSKYKGIPPFKETQGYVAAITQKWVPALGGNSIPLNYGGSGESFTTMRDATIRSMATTQATGDSTGNVTSWFQQLGAMQTGTIQDSWDANSAARNANLEMINKVIELSNSMAELMNSRNAVSLSGLSGSAGSTDYKSDKDEDRETTDLCDSQENLEWSETEKACVAKREASGSVNLQLRAD